MAGTNQLSAPSKLRRFWQNLWGQDPDLHLETHWQKFMAFWGLHVPPPGRQDRLHIRRRFFKVIGAFAVAIRAADQGQPVDTDHLAKLVEPALCWPANASEFSGAQVCGVHRHDSRWPMR